MPSTLPLRATRSLVRRPPQSWNRRGDYSLGGYHFPSLRHLRWPSERRGLALCCLLGLPRSLSNLLCKLYRADFTVARIDLSSHLVWYTRDSAVVYYRMGHCAMEDEVNLPIAFQIRTLPDATSH